MDTAFTTTGLCMRTEARILQVYNLGNQSYSTACLSMLQSDFAFEHALPSSCFAVSDLARVRKPSRWTIRSILFKAYTTPQGPNASTTKIIESIAVLEPVSASTSPVNVIVVVTSPLSDAPAFLGRIVSHDVNGKYEALTGPIKTSNSWSQPDY